MSALARILAVLLATACAVRAVHPPNTSLATLPTAYFGGTTAPRPQANIAMLARQRLVIIEKWEGPCWAECLANTSAGIPCRTSCDAERYMLDTIKAVKNANPDTSVGFYQNSLYAWTFDSLTAEFGQRDLLMRDIDGNLIGLEQDNGLKDQRIFDHSQNASVDLWLEWVTSLLASGHVDGIFLDKPNVFPLINGSHWEICEGPNGPMGSHAWKDCCAFIEASAAERYTANKDRMLVEAARRFREQKAWIASSHNGTMYFMGHIRPDVHSMLDSVERAFANGSDYVYVSNGDQHSTADPSNTTSDCSTYDLAMFLLALRERMFIGCNGDDERFSLPLGDPTGPPKQVAEHVWTRAFMSGTTVSLDEKTKTATIKWADRPRVDHE